MNQKRKIDKSLSIPIMAAIYGVWMIMALAVFMPTTALSGQATPIGQTQIAHWKSNRTAVFLLMFDDSWPSHWQVAAPELAKRGLTATFYINPGKTEYTKFKEKWEVELPKMGMVYGDHTMTHHGVKNFEDARREIGECARIIRQIEPGNGNPNRLVSYARPGVAKGKWNITAEQETELLREFHLIDRPPFMGHGAVYHIKTLAEMIALANNAITNESMEYLVVHGVERVKIHWGYQDFWALKQNIFLPFLDFLNEKNENEELWVTDAISYHQYKEELARSEVTIVEADNRQISLELKSAADPTLYDYPLTLLTHVPTTWKQVKITQGERETVVETVDNIVSYDAVPNKGLVKLQPVKK